MSLGKEKKIIGKRRGAAGQVWVAAKPGGYQYGFVDGRWINDQGGGELMQELSRFIREQSDEKVNLG